MNYKKPQIVAKSALKQGYAAGCPVNKHTGVSVGGKSVGCAKCERSGK